MKSIILCIIGTLIVFLMLARTTINGVFPYIHMEYPIRALVIIILSGVVGWIGTMIKY